MSLTTGCLVTGSTKAWIGGFGEVCPFGLVSDGKRVVANAITAKGVSTSETATFATMATNIRNIFQLDTSDATATASQILSGYTAYVRGSKISGTMTNRGAVSSSLNCGKSYTIPAGYHNGSGKVTANSLASQTSATATAAQILSGYTAWVNGSKITGTKRDGFTSATASKLGYQGGVVSIKDLNILNISCSGMTVTFDVMLNITDSRYVRFALYLS